MILGNWGQVVNRINFDFISKLGDSDDYSKLSISEKELFRLVSIAQGESF